METRIDHIAGGIHRISTMAEPYGITFNQFLIDDEQPTLIHTGEYDSYEHIHKAISEVLDPARLAYVALLHWEGDENGGMDRCGGIVIEVNDLAGYHNSIVKAAVSAAISGFCSCSRVRQSDGLVPWRAGCDGLVFAGDTPATTATPGRLE